MPVRYDDTISSASWPSQSAVSWIYHFTTSHYELYHTLLHPITNYITTYYRLLRIISHLTTSHYQLYHTLLQTITNYITPYCTPLRVISHLATPQYELNHILLHPITNRYVQSQNSNNSLSKPINTTWHVPQGVALLANTLLKILTYFEIKNSRMIEFICISYNIYVV